MGKRYNYNKTNQKKIKLVIMLSIAIIIFLLIINVYNNTKQNNKNNLDKTYFSSSDFTSVKEILEYYGNVYMSEKTLKNDKYSFVIYTKFKYDLFEKEESNETFYYKIINLIAKFSDYQNFKIIDNSKDITIKVTCENDKVKVIDINGDTNYFKTMETNIALKKYNNNNAVDFDIQSEILNQLIENNWITKNVNFGEKDSTYDKYDIYFDEGIEVRTIAGKVFNIVFTEKYKDKILNNITVDKTEDEIKEILGTPTFENIATGFFGYKGEKLYIFFYNGEVSIYRIENNDTTLEFIKLIEKYNQDKDIKSLGNSLTDLWNDYDEYNYDTNYVELIYSLKGVKIQFNVGNPNGFILYNNYTGYATEEKNIYEVTDKNELLKGVYIENTDLVYEAEANRCEKEYFKYNNEGDYSKEKLEEFNKPFTMSCSQNINNTYTKIKFISTNKEYADSELDENLVINSYIWKDDFNFIYSIKNEGIYSYDCQTRNIKKLITGNEDFEIQSIENNKLKYDDKEIEI